MDTPLRKNFLVMIHLHSELSGRYYGFKRLNLSTVQSYRKICIILQVFLFLLPLMGEN